ncbi:MAG: hypothetical protein LBP28_03895, partial [Coriobacteriales bacterium]|nr:hypothetical protein [Coriobacteriales bacterium]
MQDIDVLIHVRDASSAGSAGTLASTGDATAAVLITLALALCTLGAFLLYKSRGPALKAAAQTTHRRPQGTRPEPQGPPPKNAQPKHRFSQTTLIPAQLLLAPV